MTGPSIPLRVAVVTGSRAEYGLLRPVIRAIARHPDLTLQLLVTGTHMLPDAGSLTIIEREFPVSARVPMQVPGRTGRTADLHAVGSAIVGLTDAMDALNPRVVLILGDRIEAFAAATVASLSGRLLAHIHGGDRAEGASDESLRHAITKLAHVHFAATERSAERIRRMGEPPRWVFNTGSPAIDDLPDISPADDSALKSLGLTCPDRFAILLHHPCALSDELEAAYGRSLADAISRTSNDVEILSFAPNLDPGRSALLRGMGERRFITNLPRPEFVALLKRARLIIGNSSAGLIEAAACGTPSVNVGPRQAGRERTPGVIDVSDPVAADIEDAIRLALRLDRSRVSGHPYGDGRAAPRIADCLASMCRESPSIRKQNAY